MLTVPEALERLLALLAPVPVETVALAEAGGRVLAEPAVARRDQPPFDASAMDGYALRAADAVAGATLAVVGEAPAGRRWPGRIGPGEAVRIFTGAPVPDGADAVLIQENAVREGDAVRVAEAPAPGANIRRRGLDFAAGAELAAPRRLGPEDIALLAAMNIPTVSVRRRPRIAIVPTGDELVLPGETPTDDQIVASNNFGLAALLAAHGAAPVLRPIAPDEPRGLRAALEAAADADLMVTLGGASVGDYDLVRDVIGAEALAFYKIAMRPGKPLMAGRFAGRPLIGLPGNPVSAMVCGHLFLRPAVDALLGLPAGPPPRRRARLAADLEPGGPREHYMRARLREHLGETVIEPWRNQDSSVLTLLADADALLVHPVHAPALRAGALVEYLPLRS